MTTSRTVSSKQFSKSEQADKVLGLWFFIGAEIVLFGCLFGVYLTLNGQTRAGESPEQLFELKEIILSTFVLLSSSFTCAQALIGATQGQFNKTISFLIGTLLLALIFLGLEVHEFYSYVRDGHTFTSSPFMSSFYVLVGTHGMHVLVGCLWMIVLLVHLGKEKVSSYTSTKLEVFSLYWHFVDVVWVFIFTIVYLIGKAVVL
ncbi:cytochrome c oxidase subunit 3 [Pseudalkalibacillus decolorationis]|uniref:cytochrome c oxidase subunit 3 n=1 Tax=Pseudalkalibacillus decolorationis TaxID=163879 RepID=UPI0021482F2D|nr:cytochrome c oxidase subunit 3 [Pseudalkalibacillus decolorationis]